jgi:pimeloyl-ACP methyl ester carboxylesterase
MKIDIDGQQAYAYTGGRALDTRLPGVVFVHGALNDHSVWILQSRYLAHHGYAVLAVDLPGHGRSAGLARGVPECGEWLVRLIEACGLKTAALVGHSMGSLIALEAAARLGSRASHLFMVGTAYPMKVSEKLLTLSMDDPMRAIDLVNTLSHSGHAAKPSCPGPGFSVHGGNRALMRRMQQGYPSGNLFHSDFAACDRYAGLPTAAPRVGCSVTLILGERDQMTSAKAVAPLVESLRPSVVRLPAGHDLMAEAPDGVLDALRRGLAPSAASKL